MIDIIQNAIIASVIFLTSLFGAQNLTLGTNPRVLIPSQGGTGIGTATVGDVGRVLKVSDNSPFTYELAIDTNASSTLLSDLNTWSARQNFNGNASTTGLTVTGSTYLATTGGNVGIGTTSPVAKLAIVSNSVGAPVLVTQGAAGQTADLQQWQNSAGTVFSRIDPSGQLAIGFSAETALSAKLTIYGTNDSPLFRLGQASGVDYFLQRSGTTGFLEFDGTQSGYVGYVFKSGNVGIGTTEPQGNLEISTNGGAITRITNSATGAGILYGELAFNSSAASNAYKDYGGQIRSYSVGGVDQSTLQFYTSAGSGVPSAERMRVDMNGNVGIGTTTPATVLAVQGNSNSSAFGPVAYYSTGDGNFGTSLTLDATSNTGGKKFSIISTGTSAAQGAGTLSVYDGTAGAYRFVIDSNGVVKSLRESTLTYPTPGTTMGGFHISPTTGTNDNSGAITFGGNGASANTAQAGIYVQSSNAYGSRMFLSTTDSYGSGAKARVTISENGNVGIGTTTPRSLFHVNGGAAATTTVEFGDQYSATSKTCFNAKDISGNSISFYFISTTMVIESNRCR